MRTLLLLRHAKSSWDDPTQDDHERPLNKRGTREAPRIGQYLAANELQPDVVLCSDAVRARGTLSLVLAAMDGTAPSISFEPRLYLAEPAAILEVVGRIAPTAKRCLVVGHNPGLHALALGLIGDGEPKAIRELAKKFPTAGLAVIDLHVDSWHKLSGGAGRLRAFIAGKQL